MEKLKMYIRHVMLWEAKNNKIKKKTQQEQLRKFVVLTAKVELLTTQPETGFQNVVQTICHLEISNLKKKNYSVFSFFNLEFFFFFFL